MPYLELWYPFSEVHSVLTMADTFQDISWGIIQGFRDAVLGSVKAFKLDSEPTSPVQKKDEPMTTLARRRAEKQKTSKKSQPKKRYG